MPPQANKTCFFLSQMSCIMALYVGTQHTMVEANTSLHDLLDDCLLPPSKGQVWLISNYSYQTVLMFTLGHSYLWSKLSQFEFKHKWTEHLDLPHPLASSGFSSNGKFGDAIHLNLLNTAMQFYLTIPLFHWLLFSVGCWPVCSWTKRMFLKSKYMCFYCLLLLHVINMHQPQLSAKFFCRCRPSPVIMFWHDFGWGEGGAIVTMLSLAARSAW